MDGCSKALKEIKEKDTKLLIELEGKRATYEDSRLKEQQAVEERMRREEREFQEMR